MRLIIEKHDKGYTVRDHQGPESFWGVLCAATTILEALAFIRSRMEPEGEGKKEGKGHWAIDMAKLQAEGQKWDVEPDRVGIVISAGGVVMHDLTVPAPAKFRFTDEPLKVDGEIRPPGKDRGPTDAEHLAAIKRMLAEARGIETAEIDAMIAALPDRKAA